MISTRWKWTGENPQVVEHAVNGLSALIKHSLNDGKKVVVFGNTPEFSRGSDRLWLADALHKRVGESVEFTIESFDEEGPSLLFDLKRTEEIEKINEQVRRGASENNILYIDKEPFICDIEKEICTLTTLNREKVFYDYGHWTLEGAELIGSRLLAGGVYEALKGD